MHILWCWASAHPVVLGQCTSGWGGAGPVYIRLGVGLGQCTSCGAGPVHIRLGWCWASAHQVEGGAGPVHIRLGVGLGQCTSGWGWGWASADQVGGGGGPVNIRLGLGQCASGLGWGWARLGVGLGQCTSDWGWGWASAHQVGCETGPRSGWGWWWASEHQVGGGWGWASAHQVGAGPVCIRLGVAPESKMWADHNTGRADIIVTLTPAFVCLVSFSYPGAGLPTYVESYKSLSRHSQAFSFSSCCVTPSLRLLLK